MAAGLLVLAAGCGSRGSQDLQVLAGSSWRLAAFVDSDADEPPSDRGVPTLAFDEEARVSGSTGCNDWFGQALLGDDGRIAFGGLATTGTACDDGLHMQEERFLMTLEDAARGRIERDVLELQLDDGTTVLRFTRVRDRS